MIECPVKIVTFFNDRTARKTIISTMIIICVIHEITVIQGIDAFNSTGRIINNISVFSRVSCGDNSGRHFEIEKRV